MSPVDGFDPFGWIDLFAITPGEYLNYEIPSLSKSKSNIKGLFFRRNFNNSGMSNLQRYPFLSIWVTIVLTFRGVIKNLVSGLSLQWGLKTPWKP